MINLKKPLIFFDLETTGKDLNVDRIIQLYAIKINESGNRSSIKYVFDPLIPISKESIEIHGITEDQVKGKPTFLDKVDEIFNFFSDSDLAGYNIKNFDIPFLVEEFFRCGKIFNWNRVKVIDSYLLWTKLQPRTLTGAYKYFLNKKLEDSHEAENDTSATIEIFESQIDFFSLPDDINEIHSIYDESEFIDFQRKIKRKENEFYFCFGKYDTCKITDILKIDPGYIDWIIDKSDFPMSTKYILSVIKKKLS